MLGLVLLVPAVAVMPFRDLSGGRGQVGEAIRETVTADLKDVPGLKVIERAAIEQVIAAQGLAAKRNDLDAIASVRVGTLLGATLLVAGAYQKAGPSVRLTARFIKVETGEIVGSAKVDGAATELLALQDRVTGELVRSAGLAPPKQRRRAPAKSWRAFELYGDAVVEIDPAKKQKILKAALDEDPDFVYASRDLAALESRMTGWSRTADVQLADRERALLSRVRDGKLAAAERKRTADELLESSFQQRRYHALAAIAAQLLEGKLGVDLREPATFRLFQARERLHRFDLALQDGELYLSQFPTGPRFREVESRMHEMVEKRKKRDARRAEYQSDLAEKLASAHGLERDWAPCIAARWNDQLNDLMLEGCRAYLARHGRDAEPDAQEHAAAARFFVVLALGERGDFAEARPQADQLLATPNEWHEELRKLLSEWPTD